MSRRRLSLCMSRMHMHAPCPACRKSSGHSKYSILEAPLKGIHAGISHRFFSKKKNPDCREMALSACFTAASRRLTRQCALPLPLRRHLCSSSDDDIPGLRRNAFRKPPADGAVGPAAKRKILARQKAIALETAPKTGPIARVAQVSLRVGAREALVDDYVASAKSAYEAPAAAPCTLFMALLRPVDAPLAPPAPCAGPAGLPRGSPPLRRPDARAVDHSVGKGGGPAPLSLLASPSHSPVAVTPARMARRGPVLSHECPIPASREEKTEQRARANEREREGARCGMSVTQADPPVPLSLPRSRSTPRWAQSATAPPAPGRPALQATRP